MREPTGFFVDGGGRVGVEQAVAAVAAGSMVIVVDDPARENEGDLVMAASAVTPEAITFMAMQGRGLICVPMPRARLDELAIAPMVAGATDPLGTAFHVGVDHRARTSTGISARDRASTIHALADPCAGAGDFTQPGHVFPLAARPGGVLERAGHTEAAVDLCRLAGLPPAAVICEIVGDDGEMARMPRLLDFARGHGLGVLAIRDLIAYRRARERLIERVSEARMPLAGGEFRAIGYRDVRDGQEHLALVLGDIASNPLVRVHSECLTGDVFASRRCDCGRELQQSLTRIAAEGRGVLVYLRAPEGRRIADFALGLPCNGCDDGIGRQILGDLGVPAVSDA